MDSFLTSVIGQVAAGSWRDALGAIRERFQVDACCVRMISAESLVLIDAVGIPEHQLWIKFSVREKLPRRVLSSIKPTVVRDVFEDTLTRRRALRSLSEPDKYVFRTFVGVPLRWEGRPLGILGLYNQETETPIIDSEADVLAPVASVIAMALANLRDSALLRVQSAEINRLGEEARFDSLTRLMNRRAFEEIAEKEIARAHRGALPLALTILSIDHFKTIDETYGHEMRERILTALGTCLLKRTRRYDHLARWGSEEFLILFPGVGSETALTVTDKLRRYIEEDLGGMLDPSPGAMITCSFGVTELCAGDTDLHDLVKRADMALYHAKRTGRNICHVDRGAYGGDSPVG